MLAPSWRLPRALADVDGAVVPRQHRGKLAAVTIDNHKHADRAPEGTLVHLMLDDASARAAQALDDDHLLGTLRDDLDAVLPGARSAVQHSAVVRWPHAEPRSPVGRATGLGRLRRQGPGAAPDVHCGDDLGAPFNEGAVESELWAARQLLRLSHG